MWRPPTNPLECATADVVYCRCEVGLRFRHESREHYLRGCHDEPQYVTPLVRLNTETGEVEREPLFVQDAGGPQRFVESIEPNEQCDNCRFFVGKPSTHGYCRAHPETVSKHAFERCGEWEPR